MAGKTFEQVDTGTVQDTSVVLFHNPRAASFLVSALGYYSYVVGKLQLGSLAGKSKVAVADIANGPTGGGYALGWDSSGNPAAVTLPTATGGTSGLTTTALKTSAYTAAANERVPASTVSAPWTLQLPTAPSNGTVVETFDPVAAGSWQTNALTLARGGPDVILIGTSTATNYALGIPGGSVTLVYLTGIWYGRTGVRSRPLEASRNLADVVDAPTARTSLGLAIGVNIQAFAQFLSNLAGTAGDGVLMRLTGGTVGAIGGGSDGWVLTWDSTQTYKIKWAPAGAGGTGLTAAYTGVTDGTVTAGASGSDTIRFRAGSSKLSASVGSNDPTYGDNVLYDVNEANLNLNNMAGPLGITKGGHGQITANAGLNALLPTQGGQSGKVLGTDGTNTSWVAQTGGISGIGIENQGGASLGSATALNFTGAGVTASFSGGVGTVTIPGGAVGSFSETTAWTGTGIGATALSTKARLEARIDVRHFGAVGNGTTDDGPALQLGLNSCGSGGANAGKRLWFPPGYTFKSGQALAADGTFSIWMDSPIISTAAQPAAGAGFVALKVGQTTGSIFGIKESKYWVERSATPTWASEEDIGLELLNLCYGIVNVQRVRNFYAGVRIRGEPGTAGGSNGGACECLTIRASFITDCKHGIWSCPGGQTGWVNEVKYYIDEIDTSFTGLGSVFGIVVRKKTGAAAQSAGFDPDQHIIMQGCFQLTKPTSGDCIPVWFEQTQSGWVNKIRDECVGGSTFGMRATGACRSTVFDVYRAYSTFSTVIDDQSTDEAVCVITGDDWSAGPTDWWHSGPLTDTLWGTGANGQLTGAGISWQSWNNAGALTSITGGSDSTIAIELTQDGLIVKTSANDTAVRIGVLLDTTDIKEFVVRRYAKGGTNNDCLITFVAFDASGARLTGTAPAYVRGQRVAYSSGDLAYNQYADIDALTPLPVRVHANVKKLGVFVQLRTTIPLWGFSVGARRGAVPLYSQGVIFGTEKTASGIPEQGRFNRGHKVANSAAAVGVTQGWLCTLGGWRAPAMARSTAYRVGQLRNNSNNVYVATVAGTTASTGGPTTTASSIADGTVTWAYVGAQATFSALPNL